MHNRMHDWAFHLGFTEATWNLQAVNLGPAGLGDDAEQGRAQAGALSGSRNNANQGTGRDGLPPTTNMFLWQPIAGSAYPPCVDGDYDMTVIGHEYSHAISNRMIAGPNTGIGSFQGGAMGESWGDLYAGEYLFEHGFRAPGESPFVTGGYVTGNHVNGIRNYDMSPQPAQLLRRGLRPDRPRRPRRTARSGARPTCASGTPSWPATAPERQHSSSRARWGRSTSRSARATGAGCSCRSTAFLLQASSQFSMLDMRDNMLAADQVRFGGANQDLLWNAFAESGMGVGATSAPNDTDPIPSFASPHANNATVTLRPAGESLGANLRLYVGDYEARATPVADTDPATALPDTFQVVPNVRFQFIAVGPGCGHRKFTQQFRAGRAESLTVNVPRNLASTASGAVASGDGVNLGKLGDDTEATNWASLDGVAGKQVTIDLAGDTPSEVRRSTSAPCCARRSPATPTPRRRTRFSALRSFADPDLQEH